MTPHCHRAPSFASAFRWGSEACAGRSAHRVTCCPLACETWCPPMDDGNSPYDPELGDWQTLITVFSPTEGLLLRGLLQAAGVPAAVA
ncbi:hypothetical protein RZS08_40545, partial [Arthrospira platensis SPKY1]|nr:hypothetical protein [Arthrospira platensis SPKY1]